MSEMKVMLPDSISEAEARRCLASKLFELGRLSADEAAAMAGQSTQEFTAEVVESDPATETEIARTVALMDQIEPFQLTEEEVAAIEADRRARRDWDKAHFNENAERLRRMWP